MRRIAKAHRFLASIALTLAAALISLAPADAASKKETVIVKVNNAALGQQLARRFNWRVQKTVGSGNSAILLIEDVSEGQLKQLLKDEAAIEYVERNRVVPFDGGETVLPLDGGETVLPLDGGETVLPLGGSTDLLITQLLDGGETVLPLEDLNAIRNAYAFLSKAVTPSSRLLLQPAFKKIGLYPSIPRATGLGVIIADIDTGADTCHEALKGVVTFTFVEGPDANAPENCATEATPVVPGFGHGTRVASLLRMVAPQATIWSMRVFDNTGSAQISDIYEAVIYAADRGVNVINMSFGTSTPSEALQDAMIYARARGVTLVAAGGNSNVEPLMYPAQLWNVKGIVAVTNADIKASFSNYGRGVTFSAPGYGLWVAHPNHKIAYVAGTSYASPLVAGEAALVIDAFRRLYSGNPPARNVDLAMDFGVNFIDFLNPQYFLKLGRGRIWIPWALNTTGLPAPAIPTSVQ